MSGVDFPPHFPLQMCFAVTNSVFYRDFFSTTPPKKKTNHQKKKNSVTELTCFRSFSNWSYKSQGFIHHRLDATVSVKMAQ